jgi:hypothetical protein
VGYVSTVSGLQPPVLGAIVRVLGGDDRIQLVNYSGKPIVVKGYHREPFLRFTSAGVFENMRSPTAYLSRVRDETQAQVPDTADPAAAPAWRKVSEGSTFSWHDRRIRWTRAEKPAVMVAAPRESHLIFHWRIPAEAAGAPFAIVGFLGYAPLPAAPGGGTSPWLLALVIGGSVLALGALWAGARRIKRQAPARGA